MIVWLKLANQHSGQQTQSVVQQVHFPNDHAAISFALRCSFLCDLLYAALYYAGACTTYIHMYIYIYI